MLKTFKLRSIGVIHTPFRDSEHCPIQPWFSDARGVVEVYPEFRCGLSGVGRFTHLLLVYFFNRSRTEEMLVRPYLENRRRGVFSIRSPHRPNHLGISVVRLMSHRSGSLRVRNVDMLDGTPLLDIKPYVPQFDSRRRAGSGWLARHLEGARA